MASPSPYTAYILDAIVADMDRFGSAEDVSLAIAEYGAGSPFDSRPIDLCYGLAAVDARTGTNALSPLVIGKGLERSAGQSKPMVVNGGTLPEAAINPMSLLGSVVVQDAYVFGSVFLRSWTASNGTHINDVEANLVRGGGGGNPLVVLREVELDEAVKWLANGDIGPAQAPSAPSGATSYKTLEIVRFLVDVSYYDSASPEKNRLKLTTVDMRRPRGALGFAEETLSVEMLPTLVRQHAAATQAQAAAQEAVKALVDTWVQLDSWSPSFIEYWRNSPMPLPERLKRYLLEELNYVV